MSAVFQLDLSFPVAVVPPAQTLPESAAAALDDLLREVRAEARPYQRRIVCKALDMFAGRFVNRFGDREPAVSSVLVESPTGSGKTVMGLMIAKILQRQTGCRVGWVAMRRNLLAQAAAENARRGLKVNMETISMFDKRPPQVDLLIVDEAQHDAAQSMADLHALVRPRWTLGLSATPFRSDRAKLCFERAIADAGIGQLVQEGFLSRYHHYTLPNYTPESVAQFYAREPQRWGKTLVFFHRHDQCLKCQRLLEEAGHRSEVVTGTSDRERQLEDFAAGRLPILINMSILTEGFDCPSLKTVFCRPSGKGCTVQMAGRAFRKHPLLPFKQIVQCKETRHPLLKTAAAEEQYVWQDESWRTLTINRHLAAVSGQSLRLIASTPAELPKYVLSRRDRSSPRRFRSS